LYFFFAVAKVSPPSPKPEKGTRCWYSPPVYCQAREQMNKRKKTDRTAVRMTAQTGHVPI